MHYPQSAWLELILLTVILHTAPSQPHQAVLCRSVDHWTNSFVKVGRYFVIAQAVETVDSGWLLAGVSHICLSRPIFVIANHLNCTEVFLSLSPMTLSALSSADNSFIGFIASSAPLHKYWGHSVDTSPSPQQYCGHSVDIFISTPILRSLCRYIAHQYWGHSVDIFIYTPMVTQ